MGFAPTGKRRLITAHTQSGHSARHLTPNISSSTNPLSSRQGLDEVARMLADGMIAVRIRSTVELDGVSQMLEKLHNGGLRGKAVIRL